jgi:hypothetical protein
MIHYTFLQLTSSIKENPRLRAAAEELRKQGVKIGDVVSDALKTMEESDIMRAVNSPLFFFFVKLLSLRLRPYEDFESVLRRLLHYCIHD